jgi:Phage integrase family
MFGVRALVATLDPTSLIGVRDRALLVIGFASAFRRGELVALDVADVDWTDDGLVVTIRHSKTDQEGQRPAIGLPYGSDPATCPVRTLRAWLDAADITEGPIFHIDRHGRLHAARISGRAAAERVKQACAAAGLDAARYGGHSMQDLDHSPGGCDVELVVERQHVVGPGRLQPICGRRGLAEALALAPLGWHAQALLAPQSLDLLAVHPLALPHQHGMGTPVPPPRVPRGETPQPGAQLPVRVGLGRAVTLDGTVLADDRTGPSLRQTEPGHEHVPGSTSPRRAYQFPFATSRSAWFSSSLSATICLSSRFSRSSSFSRLASSAFMPPNWFRHR